MPMSMASCPATIGLEVVMSEWNGISDCVYTASGGKPLQVLTQEKQLQWAMQKGTTG